MDADKQRLKVARAIVKTYSDLTTPLEWRRSSLIFNEEAEKKSVAILASHDALVAIDAKIEELEKGIIRCHKRIYLGTKYLVMRKKQLEQARAELQAKKDATPKVGRNPW